jgi:hypothetical protein
MVPILLPLLFIFPSCNAFSSFGHERLKTGLARNVPDDRRHKYKGVSTHLRRYKGYRLAFRMTFKEVLISGLLSN